MSEAQVFTASAAKKGKVELPAEFSGEVNTATLHAVIRAHLGNQRQGTHSTKTRSEVSGGGRKPFKQKGTGRARQGTTRAARMRGGGIVFGPKPRNYRIELPKKVRRNALVSAFSARAGEGAVHVIESFGIEQPKTKDLVKLLHGMGLAGSKVLILTDGPNPPVFWSARNLPGVHVMRYQDANAYDVLWCSALVVEKAALTESVEEVASDA